MHMSERHTDPVGRHRSVLDDAIDRAVRQMVQVDGPPGLRGRVEARITATSLRSSAPWFRYVAAAAAIALLVFVVGLRREHAPVPQTAEKTVESRPAPQPATASRVPEPAPATVAVDAGAGVQPPRKRARAPHAD